MATAVSGSGQMNESVSQANDGRDISAEIADKEQIL